jgi:hypothetical protein
MNRGGRPADAAPRTQLTDRQRKLHAATVAGASHIAEQLLMLTVQANRVGASERDVRVIRELLLAGHVRECKG